MFKCKYLLPLIFSLSAALLIIPARAQLSPSRVIEETDSANRSFIDGRVSEAIEKLTNLLSGIDPIKDKEAYWITSSHLIEMLSQLDNHTQANKFINALIATKIPLSGNQYYLQWTQFFVGRNLTYLGNPNEGEKFLRLLASGDARLVHSPAQRAAAVVMSTIELDRRNISQSSIWMRRAVIGVLVDKAAGSEEIIDVLTRYAIFLSRTRRLIEADILFRKLAPLYDQNLARRGSKYLFFASSYLTNLSGLGLFPQVDNLLKLLNDTVAQIDIVSSNVSNGLFHDNLDQLARQSGAHPASSTEPKPIVKRLKQIVAESPNILNQGYRAAFSYYALLAGELDLADQLNSTVDASAPGDDQDAAYEIFLRSFIAARRNKFDDSVASVRDGLNRLHAFHQLAENESSDRLPAISIHERLVLGWILGLAAPHISTFDQANSLFQLQQYLNRDKGKLGLTGWAARQKVKSDLQREDIRSRDRLLVLRDSIMQEATDVLLNRVLPWKQSSPGQQNDYGPLIRLEEIEDNISRAQDNQQRVDSGDSKGNFGGAAELAAIQKLLRPDEALLLHAFVIGNGIVTTCINSTLWSFNVSGLDADAMQQLDFDYRLLTNAVHANHPPSVVSDSEFPSDSSYRVYQAMFRGTDTCLQNKKHVFLATDPDLFSLPWNALLTEAPSSNLKFSHRNAAWLPKLYSLSLLPSVESLYQLRAHSVLSRAKKNFLGVGAPDLHGKPEQTKQIALAPLFSSRGVANRAAILELEPLPGTADELRIVAKSLGTSESTILLGPQATERELRRQPMNDYRVISFATHAVVAGEISGITEPALVFTPGLDEHNQKNDGLLTATEVANLALDANLVILSACNTAESDGKAGGRGLSGLADAFFFAGARSIAVTQWKVEDAAAKKIASGLISKSLSSRSAGVAEGLRQTMLDYVSSAHEDYLAHPRFWAAFMIAGEGAVRPLDGVAANSDDGKTIKVDWEYLISNSTDSELSGLTKTNKSAYAIGIQKPPAGEQRAGSYLTKISGRRVDVIFRDAEMARTGVVSLGSRIGILGFYPAGTKSSAVFRLMDAGGQELWRHVEDSGRWNFPISIIQADEDYILLSLDTELASSGGQSSLILSLVSGSGISIKQQRIPIELYGAWSSPNKAILSADGILTVAIVGKDIWQSQSKVWTNQLTGSKRYCTKTDSTVLLSIDTKTFLTQSKKILDDQRVVSIRQHNGHLYAASTFESDCRLETNARLVEISPTFELKPLFQTNNVNSVEVRDFLITAEYFVFVGSIKTFLPTALTKTIMSPAQLNNYQAPDLWADSFWEKNEQVGSGFILVIRHDGIVVADRVFPDLLNRSISDVIAMGRNRFLAVGSAVGERGWMLQFSVPALGYSLKDSVSSWFRSILASFDKGQGQ